MAGRPDPDANSDSDRHSYTDANSDSGPHRHGQRNNNPQYEWQGCWRGDRYASGAVGKPDDFHERERKLLILGCRNGSYVHDHAVGQ